jgi:hypothetical protein
MRDVLVEVGGQSGQLRQFRRQVAPLGALHAALDFLQSDQVRLRVENHAGDPFDVQFAVDTFGVMDVVRHHAHRDGCRLRKGE